MTTNAGIIYHEDEGYANALLILDIDVIMIPSSF